MRPGADVFHRSVNYIAAAINELATADPSTIANKEYGATEFKATGQEVVDALTVANGAAPTVSGYTKADFDADRVADLVGVVRALYKFHWKNGDYPGLPEVEVKE